MDDIVYTTAEMAQQESVSKIKSEVDRVLLIIKNFNAKWSILKRRAVPDHVILKEAVNILNPNTRFHWEKSLKSSNEPITVDRLLKFLNNRCTEAKRKITSSDTMSQGSINVVVREYGSLSNESSRRSSFDSSRHQQQLLTHGNAVEAKLLNIRRKDDDVEKQSRRSCGLGSEAASSSAVVSSANLSAPVLCNKPISVLVHDGQLYGTTVLPTALVSVITASGKVHRVRALLDQQSQSSFLSQRLANVLQQILHSRDIYASVRKFGREIVSTALTGRTKITVKSCCFPLSVDLDVSLRREVVTSYDTWVYQPTRDWLHIHDLQLADNELDDSCKDKPIELLLGVDVFKKILLPTNFRRPLCSGDPVARQTIFGWVLFGPIETPETNNSSVIDL